MLPGLIPYLHPTGPTTPQLVFEGAVGGSISSSSGVYTYNSVTFGTAFAGRFLIVAASFANVSSAACSISSVTIGGISATKLAEQDIATTGDGVAFWGATVPTGTSGTVVVTCTGAGAGTGARGDIAVYAATVASTSPFSTNTAQVTGGTSSISATISCQAGGFVLGVVCGNSTGGRTYTWTGGYTKDYDQANGGSVSTEFSGVSQEFGSAQSGVTVTATPAAAFGASFLSSLALVAMK